MFTLKADIKNPLCEFEDAHQQIFLRKFHETPTLPRGGDVILGAGGQQN